ncbi:MAG TPA: hypothetical protein DCM08_08095, partial [Microscillaceae bacterium]|nr:hypothetical protein [Microscillaceae bacterium]
YYNRDLSRYDSVLSFDDMLIANLPSFRDEREEIFSIKGFNKSGTISRGIAFGNTQSTFVNSALNLQIDGPITENIKLKAAISDQNIPFQPDGNTLQLQQFDRVFVQLEHKNGTLTAGDIVFKNQDGYFLKYYKNVQGALLETKFKYLEGKHDIQSKLGISVSKGKFASVNVDPLESVQGPYRLRGPNNEPFIIVLANSEKVFLDGRLLKRGFNYDYVIDYNLGEITFNNQIVITRFSRIRVDFEFAERNYARVNIAASHYQTFEKGRFYANYYREADNPNSPLGLNLSDQDKIILSQAGNDPRLAIIDGVDSVGFTPNRVLYRQVDTLVNGQLFSPVYVFSTNQRQAFLAVTFSDVGQGNGDYVRANTTINGQVFEWRAPVNGLRQGNFAPVRAVPTPNLKQLITAGTVYQLSEKQQVFVEGALSTQDANLFSPRDDANNQGWAIKAGYKNEGTKIGFLNNYEWVGAFDYEYNSRFFKPIDRFREIEFNRDWNLPLDTGFAAERIINAKIGYKRPQIIKADPVTLNDPAGVRVEDIEQPMFRRISPESRLIYRFSYRDRERQIAGWQQEVDFFQALGKLYFRGNLFLMRNEVGNTLSTWERLQTDVSYNAKHWILGYQYNQDKNITKNIQRDSITTTLMNFEEQRVYLKSPDSARFKYRLDYTYRFDYAPLNGKLFQRNVSNTFNLTLNTKIHTTQSIGIIFNYRDITDRLNPSDNSLNVSNITSRIDWTGAFLKRHITSELTLTTSTGRELQREFVFLPIANGLGTHTWRDDNNDGVQDLNEFYLAINPDERNFIKVFVPTNRFISAFSNQMNYRLNWEAPRQWAKLKGFRGFLGKFSNNFSWTISRRMTDPDLGKRFLPFLEVSDLNLLSNQDVLRNTLFFNRTSPSIGFDIGLLNSNQKQLLTNGFEQRSTEEWRFNFRKNIGKQLNFKMQFLQRNQQARSDFLLTRNYNILTREVLPEFSFQPNPTLRLVATYGFAVKENLFKQENRESARVNQAIFELRWNKLNQRNLIANVRYLQIDYQGDPNTPVGYEMLEALRPGTNWTWSVNLRQTLFNGLQLTLTYEGRQSPLRPIVHIGRVQVSALF